MEQVKLSKVIGPGVWFTIHLKAYNVNTVYDYREFIRYLHTLSYTFPCEDCRVHFKRYLSMNPPENEWGRTYKISDKVTCNGLFLWTVIFHNEVNVRLGKPEMKAIDVWEKYDTAFMNECSEKCKYVPDGDYLDYINRYKESKKILT